MSDGEIEVPKEVRETVPWWMRQTRLGHKRGALRQYRDGNLHVREYGDKYTVHEDASDPRIDPLGHLLFDAQEVLAGISCGALAGYKAAKISKDPKIAAAVSIAAGLVTYLVAKKLKERR